MDVSMFFFGDLWGSNLVESFVIVIVFLDTVSFVAGNAGMRISPRFVAKYVAISRLRISTCVCKPVQHVVGIACGLGC